MAREPTALPWSTSIFQLDSHAAKKGFERLVLLRDGAHRGLPHSRHVWRRGHLGKHLDERAAGRVETMVFFRRTMKPRSKRGFDDGRPSRGGPDAIGISKDLLDRGIVDVLGHVAHRLDERCVGERFRRRRPFFPRR